MKKIIFTLMIIILSIFIYAFIFDRENIQFAPSKEAQETAALKTFIYNNNFLIR